MNGIRERPHANHSTVLPAGCWNCVSTLKLPSAAIKYYGHIERTLFIFGWWISVPHRYFGQFPPPSFETQAGSSWTLMDHIKCQLSPGGFSSFSPTADRAALSYIFITGLYWCVLVDNIWHLTALFPPPFYSLLLRSNRSHAFLWKLLLTGLVDNDTQILVFFDLPSRRQEDTNKKTQQSEFGTDSVYKWRCNVKIYLSVYRKVMQIWKIRSSAISFRSRGSKILHIMTGFKMQFLCLLLFNTWPHACTHTPTIKLTY